MTDGIDIRAQNSADAAALDGLYAAAFADEDLRPLVRDLTAAGAHVLSLVAVANGAVAGHVVFTRAGVDGGAYDLALLGPLAVAPGRQRSGIGTALVRAGLDQMQRAGVVAVFVLGDPGYYGRFGFRAETGVAPPYPLPAAWREAWESLSLGGAGPPPAGRLHVPAPWRRPALWGP